LTSPHRADHPYAVAHDLALRHQGLEQTAMVGFILAVRRYAPERGGFRPFARLYANVKVRHFQRDRVFLIKVSPSWRELHARGRKLQGAPALLTKG
jgi:DNA-directed RNA polymerase specialized sigma subunit